MPETDKIRRRLIKGLLYGAAGYFLYRFFRPADRGREVAAVIKLSDIPAAGAYIIKDKRIAVISTGAQMQVLDITCTHLGCTLSVTDEHMQCPCHGSRFSLTGEVLKGPAGRDLRKLEYEIDGKEIKVYA